MKFVLTYEGILLPDNRNTSTVENKHQIRCHINQQLYELYASHPSLEDWKKELSIDIPSRSITELFPLRGFNFIPFMTRKLWMNCHLDILFLQRQSPGNIILQGGDIDSRLKTLFDGLRMPNRKDELPPNSSPGSGENPFLCLLEDDGLITAIRVETDRLLYPSEKPGENNSVRLVIAVTVKITRGTNQMLGFAD